MNHWVIYINNKTEKRNFIKKLLQGTVPAELETFQTKKGVLYSSITLEQLIAEEDRHDRKIISSEDQALETMSSGEQKRVLLYYLLRQNPDFIILDNPFDNLDVAFQQALKTILEKYSSTITFIQLASRKADTLPFITNYGIVDDTSFKKISFLDNIEHKEVNPFKNFSVPPAIEAYDLIPDPLVQFKDVSVFYGDKPILNKISWTVKKGEFWQLIGPNGSGKTTILSMITGDNPKAFAQEIYLFGSKKGSGESVWDIKQKIGYYSPAMTNKFKGRHTVEHMLIAGLTDSIGLYTIPTEIQKRTIKQWLILLHFQDLKDSYFNTLSIGQQRLIMTARAMVKHPPLLILDEPTAGMDDASAKLLVALVNKMAQETNTTILFVSHRAEPGLTPKKVYTLKKNEKGSIGITSSYT